MVHIWQQLWDDFLARAQRFDAGHPPAASVDLTIRWQREGAAFAYPGVRLAVDRLKLPTIYLGAPWQNAGSWVAFVTLNPSITDDEIVSRLQHRRSPGDGALVSLCDDYHLVGYHAEPLSHGRQPAMPLRPKVYVVGPNGQPVPQGNQTWSLLEGLLRDATQQQTPGLGYRSTIMDVVPWAFRNWGRAVARRGGQANAQQLAQLGYPHLSQAIDWVCNQPNLPGGPPKGICFLGAATWPTVEPLLREANALRNPADLRNDVWEYVARFGGRAVPVLKAYQPTAPGFNAQRDTVVAWLQRVL